MIRRRLGGWVLASFVMLVSSLGCEGLQAPSGAMGPPSRPGESPPAPEYWASAHGDTIQAANRSHDLQSHFGPTGVRVHARTRSDGPPLVELQLARLGRGEDLDPVGPGEVRHEEARVEIDRSELGLVEWFENSPEGLEQGFTLALRPDGEAGAEALALVLELSVEGARASRSGDAVRLATAAGRDLEYGKLAVVDALGRTLLARFDVPSPDRVRLVVDDRGARYPIVVDPLLTSTADTQIESNLASARLGTAIASAGDVNGDGYLDLIVGSGLASATSNAVYVFHGGPSGVPSGGAAGANTVLTSTQASIGFGAGVASAGDVNGDGFDDVIVGATNYNSGLVGEGAAFVYLGSPTGIASGNESTASARLESNQLNARFGNAVASAGDVNGDGYADVVVGSFQYDLGQTDEGAAFVFLGSATGIANGNPATAHAVLQADQSGANLGVSVASAGDVNADGFGDVIVGATLFDNGSTNEGAAFIFHGSSTGVTSGSPATAATVLESNQTGSANLPNFGVSVASAGDVDGDGYADVIVGANAYDPGPAASEIDAGAAFIFRGGATGVANGNPSTAASVLRSTQGGSALLGSSFGNSVGSAGDVNGDGYSDVIVGAPRYDLASTNQGAAFVYLGNATGNLGSTPGSAYRQLSMAQADAAVGTMVSSAGDVDGDGFDDVLAAATGFDGGQIDEGALLVYRGGATEPRAESFGATQFSGDGFELVGNFPLFDFGYPDAAGDVNGDGYGDVILGVPNLDAGGIFDTGKAFVFHGSPTGIVAPNLQADTELLSSGGAAEYFGYYATAAGDVNGDGFGDVLVTGKGFANLYLGSATGIQSGGAGAASARFDVSQPGSGLIAPVTAGSAGDVNGDGYDDILVGAPYFDSGDALEGAAFLFLGGATVADGNPSSAHARFESNQSGAQLGTTVFTAGDVNGDGFDDIVIGASSYDAGEVDEGAAFLFLGSATGMTDGSPATAHVRFETDRISAFGGVVRSAGDVNRDGYGDVVAAWPRYATDADGVVAIFHGSSSGISDGHVASADSVLIGEIASRFGDFVSPLGDHDGDGFDDLVMLAGGNVSVAYILAGSPSGIPGGFVGAHARYELTGLGVFQGAGDVNGDGFGDVVNGYAFHQGIPGNWSNTLDVGIVVHHVNALGRPLSLGQRQAGAPTTVVSPGGNVEAASGVRAELLARSPRGREIGKVEVELCPADVAFGDASCTTQTTPTWVDLGLTGAHMSETFTNLSIDTRFAWRARTLFTRSSATQPGITPIVRKGPWFRMSRRIGTEDFRTTVPEPGVAGAVALGAALLARLARRRRAMRSAPEPDGRSARRSS
jgi:hypothetical protein